MEALTLGSWVVDLARHVVVRDRDEEPLTPLEANLLAYLAARSGTVVSQQDLLTDVWGYAVGVSTRTVSSTIRRLRSKIEPDPKHPRYLLTCYGRGFRLDLPVVVSTAAGDAINFSKASDLFVGRTHELSRLASLCAIEARLVTIAGPAGSGKTRLMREHGLGTASGPRAPSGGVWFCDLTTAVDPYEVAYLVAQALEIPLGMVAADRAGERVAAALVGRGSVLLLMDNCEQLSASALGLLSSWLEAAPVVQLVCSSRRPLQLEGERVIGLEPLPLPEAVTLLRERARATRAGPEPDRELVEHLAEQLDRLPLALELAASRLASMGWSEVSSRMQERFRLLRRASDNSRHDSLYATIDWSWNQLEAWEQDALAQVAVFRGGFGLDAAEAVVDLHQADAHWMPDILDVLRLNSLVRVEHDQAERARYDLLVTVRAYAAQRQPTGCEERHAAWFGRITEQALEERRTGKAWRWILADDENVREACVWAFRAGALQLALRLAVAFDALWSERHSLSERLELLERALAIPGDGQRAAALRACGDIKRMMGDFAGAESDLVVAAREAVGDEWLAARVELTQAALLASRGDHSAAVAGLQSARTRLAEIGDRRGVAICLVNLLAIRDPEPDRLLEVISDARRAITEQPELEAALLINLAPTVARAGHLGAAEGMHRDAVALAESLQSRPLLAGALHNLANFLNATGRLPSALGAVERSICEYEFIGDQRGGALAQVTAAAVLMHDDLESAERYLVAACRCPETNPQMLARANLGVVRRLQGHTAEALDVFERVDADHLLPDAAAQTQLHHATTLADLDRVEEARTLLDQVRANAGEQMQSLLELAEGHLDLATWRVTGATSHRERAFERRRVLDPPPAAAHEVAKVLDYALMRVLDNAH